MQNLFPTLQRMTEMTYDKPAKHRHGAHAAQGRASAEPTSLGARSFAQPKNIVPLSLMVLVIALAYAYVFTTAAAYDSDHVEGTLWALASLESGSLLNPDFYYAYAIPFGGNLFILPFVALMGPCILANRCGMALFLTVMIALLLYLAKGLFDRLDLLCIFVSAALIVLATDCGRNLMVHVIYYGLGFVASLGMLGCLVRIIRFSDRPPSRSKEARVYAFLAFFCAWGSSNGVAAIGLSVLPIGAALLIVLVANRARLKHRAAKTLLCMAGGLAVGLIAYYLAMRGIRAAGYETTSGTFSLATPSEMLQNAAHLWWGWTVNFHLNCFFKDTGIEQPAFAALWTILCLAVTFCPLLFLAFWKRFHTAEKLLFFSYVCMAAICLAECVFTTRGSLSDYLDFPRLLYNALLMNFIIVGVLCAKVPGAKANQPAADPTLPSAPTRMPSGVFWVVRAGYLAIGLLVLVCFVGMRDNPAWASTYLKFSEKVTTITEMLQAEGLTQGYATYWRSNVITVTSGGSIEVATVKTDTSSWSGISDFRHNTLARFYESDGSGKDFFVLLTDSEFASLGSEASALSAASKDCLRTDGLVVLIFDSDCWTDVITQPTA